MASAAELVSIKAKINGMLRLPAAKKLLQLNSNTCERAYEAYIFALCCQATQEASGKVVLTGVQSGPNPHKVVFRGAPGSMASKAQDFVYANCTINSKTFEIHVDVEYQGTSGSLHEVDVSFCDRGHAEQVRDSSGTPKASRSKLIIAIECKYYEKAPGVSVGRTFVGLLDDCGAMRLRLFASNLPSTKLQQYLAGSKRPKPFLGLNPIDMKAEDRFRNVVQQELRQWAQAV